MYEKDTTNYLKNHKINLIAFMKSRALAKLNSNTIREAQYTRICNTISHIERSEISKMPIKKIRDVDIQKYLNTLIIDYSNSTISKIYGEFRQVFAGLRIGEVLALNIDDIDFKGNIIRVNKTLTVDGNGKIY